MILPRTAFALAIVCFSDFSRKGRCHIGGMLGCGKVGRCLTSDPADGRRLFRVQKIRISPVDTPTLELLVISKSQSQREIAPTEPGSPVIELSDHAFRAFDPLLILFLDVSYAGIDRNLGITLGLDGLLLQ